MILSIIIFTASVLGLGYAMYNSKVENNDNSAQELGHNSYIFQQQSSYTNAIGEANINRLLNELEEHLYAYQQYYERKTWENHNCRQLTEQCMALPENSKERLELYQRLKHDVTQLLKYERGMEDFARNELHQGWDIALELKNMDLVNTAQADIFDKYWQQIVPYATGEKYNHPVLENNKQLRDELVEQNRLDTIQRIQQYEQTHQEMLQWEQEYNLIKGETLMADAELATAKQDMIAADYDLAVILAKNPNEPQYPQILAKAYSQATEQQLIFNEAQTKATDMNKAMLDMEIAKMDKYPQVMQDHSQPGEELHPQEVPTVAGNDIPPVGRGGWWSEFIQWIWSWIS